MLVEDRSYNSRAGLDEISTNLIAATLAAEDARFFLHPGFDPLAIVRAAFNSLRGAKPASGASTITQQLVKERDREIRSKIQNSSMCGSNASGPGAHPRGVFNRSTTWNCTCRSASRYYLAKPPSA